MFGLKIGSTATTGAGLIASGAAAAGGGVVGGATLISGGIDAYHAIKSDEAAEKKAYGTSAGLKVGGVAGGAALGAAIGSVIPGLGTVVGGLIGAGIGGIAGWFGGNKVKEDYEETKQAAEEAAAAAELMEQKSKYALEGSRFENSKLKDAFNDTTVSAERFASMMQEAASKKVQDSFGNIKLSVKEIKDAAKQIVFGDQEQAFTKFSSAASDAQNSLANLQSSVSTMDKLNWKASLGMKFDDNEISEYIAGVDNISNTDINSSNVGGLYSYYKPAIQQARAILSLNFQSHNEKNGENEKGFVYTIPYTINMETLFEYYARTELKKALKGSEYRVEQYSKKLYLQKDIDNVDDAEKGIHLMSFCIPDIIIYKEDKPVVVIDAKYKLSGRPDRSDSHQLLSYVLLTGADRCGFVLPGEKTEVKEMVSTGDNYLPLAPRILRYYELLLGSKSDSSELQKVLQ